MMDNRKGIFKQRLTVESLCGCIILDKIFMEHQKLLIRNQNFNIESIDIEFIDFMQWMKFQSLALVQCCQ